MSAIILMTADFIEKMNNPSNGPLINEEYALRMGKMMEDERLIKIFAEQVTTIKDANTLSSYGWIWLIQWCRVNKVPLHDDIMLELALRWSNVFIQSAVIDLALAGFIITEKTAETSPENTWLTRLINRCTAVAERNDDDYYWEKEAVNTQPARNLLIALLQLGNETAIKGANQLLAKEWPGQRFLINYLNTRYNGLDIDARRAWEEQIERIERK